LGDDSRCEPKIVDEGTRYSGEGGRNAFCIVGEAGLDSTGPGGTKTGTGFVKTNVTDWAGGDCGGVVDVL